MKSWVVVKKIVQWRRECNAHTRALSSKQKNRDLQKRSATIAHSQDIKSLTERIFQISQEIFTESEVGCA
jgi:hypothetical protein